jgi:hypothetical protein
MCPYCDGFGCKLDCSNAPWNFDRPVIRVSKLSFMLRFARWKREISGCSLITADEIAWM